MNKSLLSWKDVCLRVSQVVLVVKNPPATAGELRDAGPGSGWENLLEEGTPVFLPGASHGQSLAGCSPQHHKESDMTKVTWHAHTHVCLQFSSVQSLSHVRLFVTP